MTRGELRILDDDLFGVGRRLKSIDEGYFVAFNVKKTRFEIHNAHQRGSTLALVVPYAELDARTVTLCLRTRCERAKELYAEMEKENKRAEATRMQKTIANAELATEQVFRQL